MTAELQKKFEAVYIAQNQAELAKSFRVYMKGYDDGKYASQGVLMQLERILTCDDNYSAADMLKLIRSELAQPNSEA